MSSSDLVRFGGAEVFNTERLAAYVANGVRPDGVQITVPAGCDGLGEALGGTGWPGYRTPIQDEPPWFDGDEPDSWDFAGLLPLALTGLDDTTRTVAVVPTVAGAGLPGQVSREPLTIGATALLVGRTTEAVQAGLAWLRRVLHGACDAAEQPCGPAAPLEVLTACPGPFYATPNPDAPVTVTVTQPFAVGGDPAAWNTVNGFLQESGAYALIDPAESQTTTIWGGPADPPAGDSYDAGAAEAEAGITYVTGGAAEPLPPAPAVVSTLRFDGCDYPGPVTLTWRISSVDLDGILVRLALLGPDGLPAEEGLTTRLNTNMTDYSWTVEPPGDGPWTVGLLTSDPVLIEEVRLDGFLPLTPEECIAPYRRRYPVVVTASGPVVTETIESDCATLLVVEWVWVSATTHRYGPSTPLFLGLGWNEPASYAAPGVLTNGGPPAPIAATPWDCAPPAPPASCAIDPGASTWGTPPALPAIPDTNRPRITTQLIREVWAMVGPEQVPANEGVLSLDLTAGSAPVVGIRVRVWDDAEADGSVPDNCNFAYEFLIDYIPANGVLTIDGTSGRITTRCAGEADAQDSSQGVRGAYGGPVQEPVVRCDRRYLIRVQWLDVYPRTAAPVYTQGDPNGALTVDAYVTPREG